jgi:hypothetical protein
MTAALARAAHRLPSIHPHITSSATSVSREEEATAGIGATNPSIPRPVFLLTRPKRRPPRDGKGRGKAVFGGWAVLGQPHGERSPHDPNHHSHPLATGIFRKKLRVRARPLALMGGILRAFALIVVWKFPFRNEFGNRGALS